MAFAAAHERPLVERRTSSSAVCEMHGIDAWCFFNLQPQRPQVRRAARSHMPMPLELSRALWPFVSALIDPLSLRHSD